ncbi:MAG TPA: DoxX family protein [Bryobacteraceae bacterium]|nr:DoxX family protein [Bryobacteraceae bacterium]
MNPYRGRISHYTSTSCRQLIAYWVTTALVVCELILGGVWDVMRVPQVRGLIERLGYPPYFLVILGIWKLLGAVALVIPRFPRLKEWAYAGVFFDLTGAVASLSASGLIDAGTMAYPMVMTGVAVASWALRPPSRRLGSP